MQQGRLQPVEGIITTIACQKATWAHNRKIPKKKNLDLVPYHDAETAFAERLLVPLEERGVVERLLAALHSDEHGSERTF